MPALIPNVHLVRSCLYLICLFWLSACSSGDSSPADEPPLDDLTLTPVLEDANKKSATIGVEGGTIETTGSNGIVYRLIIPADTLPQDTEVSLTPVAEIPDLPMDNGLLAAVHFEPDGLELYPPATLEIDLIPGVDTDGILGFDYKNQGEDMQLNFGRKYGDQFRTHIYHFSGAGAGRASGNERGLDLLTSDLSTNVKSFMALADFSTMTIDTFVSNAVNMYHSQFGVDAEFALEFGEKLDVEFLLRYANWKQAFLFDAGYDIADLLKFKDLVDVINRGDQLFIDFIKPLIADRNQECIAAEDLARAEFVLNLQALARWVAVDNVEDGLDLDTMLDELCVQIAFEETDFAFNPVVDAANTLTTKVGVSFNGGPTRYENPVKVAVDVNPGTATQSVLTTDVDGYVSTGVTPESKSLRIDMTACLGANFRRLDKYLCQQAFILRGIVVTPDTVEVSPGGTVEFSATINGESGNVTWSTDGGNIDDAGQYTASNTAGLYTVSATSDVDPELSASASITITGPDLNEVTGTYNVVGHVYDYGECSTNPDGSCKERTAQVEVYADGDVYGLVVLDDGIATGLSQWDDYVGSFDGTSLTGLRDCYPTTCEMQITFSPGTQGALLTGLLYTNSASHCACYFEIIEAVKVRD